MVVNIFIQARMSSLRYPGKVLAPIQNTPLIKCLIDSVSSIKNKSKVVVLTSTEASDDPLAAFLNSIDCSFFRGSLNNVFERFQKALIAYPCDYFVRLCADSPFLDPNLIEIMIEKGVEGNYDLISNVFSRNFPKGQSVEVLKSSIFQNVSNDILSNEEREHVFPYFYKNKEKNKCLSFELLQDLGHVNQCIDTIEDMKGIELKRPQYVFDESELCIITH